MNLTANAWLALFGLAILYLTAFGAFRHSWMGDERGMAPPKKDREIGLVYVLRVVVTLLPQGFFFIADILKVVAMTIFAILRWLFTTGGQFPPAKEEG